MSTGATRSLSACGAASVSLSSSSSSAVVSSSGEDRATSARPAMPNNLKLDRVNVPVLSKQHVTTLPAKGIRNGSVQKIPSFTKFINDVFTANDNSIGNSGGTTDVIIIVQFKNNFHRSRLSSCNPTLNTYAPAINANTNNTMMNIIASLEFAVIRSVPNKIVRNNLPCDVSKPVRITYATAPPSGACIFPEPVVVCNNDVPANNTERRCLTTSNLICFASI
mmetsp:Transcript_17425/g.30412  ORF Transcript_17425/g.30412 Transcript_17425/m.30412 type:complete len:222 (+) Transcript_17425:481-1146(+)